MRDAGHQTPDAGHQTAEKAKIIYPPPRGVDIIHLQNINTNKIVTTSYSSNKLSKWGEKSDIKGFEQMGCFVVLYQNNNSYHKHWTHKIRHTYKTTGSLRLGFPDSQTKSYCSSLFQ